MSIYFVIGAILLSYLTFMGAILALRSNYFKRYKNAFSFKNYYPYELNYELQINENLLGNCLLFLSVLGIFGAYACGYFLQTSAFSYVIASVGLVSGAVPLILSFAPVSKGRLHLGMVALTMLLAFLAPALNAIESFRIFNTISNKLALASFILDCGICLVLFILVMNPKLNKWAELETVKNEDGTISYVRPKFFPLAFTEWMIIFINFVSLIPYCLLLFTVK